MSAVEARRGQLPAPHSSVTVSVEPYAWVRGAGAIVTYLSTTLEALLAARCITEEMLRVRKRGVRWEDEHGDWYRLHRSPTKKLQNRLKLIRDVHDVSRAPEVPGVRELFPEGLPHWEPPEICGSAAASEPAAANLADWAEHERSGLQMTMWASLASLESSIARASGVESEHEEPRELANIARPDPVRRLSNTKNTRGGCDV